MSQDICFIPFPQNSAFSMAKQVEKDLREQRLAIGEVGYVRDSSVLKTSLRLFDISDAHSLG